MVGVGVVIAVALGSAAGCRGAAEREAEVAAEAEGASAAAAPEAASAPALDPPWGATPRAQALMSPPAGEARPAAAIAVDGRAAPFDYCEGRPPDAACYAARRDPGSARVALARALADRAIERHPPATLAWDWEETVLMLGVAELHRVSGEPRYRDYVRAYVDAAIAAGGPAITTSDSCAPALLAALLVIDGDDPSGAYRAIVDDALDYLDHRALRTPAGGLNHLGVHGHFGASLWVDSLFMIGGLLTRWGEAAAPARLDLYRDQFVIFAGALQGEDGLFAHASGWPGEQDPTLRWARGDAWALAAGHDYLRARRIRGEEDPAVAAIVAAEDAAVLAAQDRPSGLWWTLVDRPGEGYLETSASALFAYALARGWRYGQVDHAALPAIERAIVGLGGRIVDDAAGRPVVRGISGPTLPGTRASYLAVPLVDDRPYGVGAVILALVESSGLPAGPPAGE